MNEATARIKINKLLEAAGWRFFADGNKPANICLETGVTIKASDLDSLGLRFLESIRPVEILHAGYRHQAPYRHRPRHPGR